MEMAMSTCGSPERLSLWRILSARLEEASDRRRALLDSRVRMARAMSGDAVAQFLRLEASMMRQALTNLWRLKLEAASARRNIFLNQRKRRAYELGDEIVRVSTRICLSFFVFVSVV